MKEISKSATNSLIAIITAAYLLQILIPNLQGALLLTNIDYINSTNQWYRFFTVALTHGGFIHLAFNMVALLILGNPIEKAFGRKTFLIIFFVSLLTASFASSNFGPGNTYSVGASGAVFGLFGAMLMVGAKIGAETKSIITIIAINFLIGFILGGVDWRGHLGGIIGGAVTSHIIINMKR